MSLFKLTILCGDFNLRPDTKSMGILNQYMHNLIEKYNINSTRTALYPRAERYADYVLISPDIRVNNFQVLDDVVSDHAPLLLDFE